jgi:hypothetical protein
LLPAAACAGSTMPSALCKTWPSAFCTQMLSHNAPSCAAGCCCCCCCCRFHNAISPLQDTAELIAQELLPPKTAASILTRYRNQVRRLHT